jgi:hypothetical protein
MDLICYTYPGWAPRIRPASPKRDWMEKTPERFAYRCLPLAIANAHGWELLSPCGFEARWTGSLAADGVEIRVDPGNEGKQKPVALFGHGTVTFHVEGIFRTPEGWNLWAGGPPNAAKDGIVPLGGVIETDWSPYTFTMNWRFTRPNHWVRFEENEPFCFIFPVQREILLETEPRIRPMSDEPGLKEAFETWSKSRDDFHKWIAENPPEAPADHWQKLYFRGQRPDGSPGPDDHKSKLRLKPFRNPDGSVMEPPEPKPACPVAHQSAPAAAAPAILAAAAPLQNPALALTLNRLGFNAAPQTQAPVFALPAQTKPNGGLAEKRGNWLLAAMERQRGLVANGAVPRERDLSGDDFLGRYYSASRPVVIEGAIEDWPARTRWTPDYLKRKVGKARVEYQAGRDGDPDFELYKDRHKESGPFDAFIDRIRRPGNDAYLTAYNSATNRSALRALDRDLGALDDYLTPGHGMIWIGPGGTFTPLHFDLTNNLIAQVVGTKDLLLVPPSETPKMYNRRHVFSDVRDLADAARLDACPLARDVRSYAVELKPGDILYVPVGWWHQVRARDFSVTLTHTNFRWPNDAWERFPGD